MDSDRFDTLARSLTAPSRRHILAALVAALSGSTVAVDDHQALARRKQHKHHQDRRKASPEHIDAEGRKKKKKKKKKASPVAAAPCVPSCAGKVCGGDGCGGTCGVACTGGRTCQNGTCLCPGGTELCNDTCVAACGTGSELKPSTCTCCKSEGSSCNAPNVNNGCCSGMCRGTCSESGGTCFSNAYCMGGTDTCVAGVCISA